MVIKGFFLVLIFSRARSFRACKIHKTETGSSRMLCGSSVRHKSVLNTGFEGLFNGEFEDSVRSGASFIEKVSVFFEMATAAGKSLSSLGFCAEIDSAKV